MILRYQKRFRGDNGVFTADIVICRFKQFYRDNIVYRRVTLGWKVL